MAQDLDETNRLLGEILSAVQALDHRLREHESRIGDLENVSNRAKDLQEPAYSEMHQTPSNAEGRIGDLQRPVFSYAKTLEVIDEHVPTFDRMSFRLFSQCIGNAWTLPPDHRIDLGFQKDSLEKLSAYDLKLRLEDLRKFNSRLLGTNTPIESKFSRRRNWYRHLTIEDTMPHAPFDSWTYTIGHSNARSFARPGDQSGLIVQPSPHDHSLKNGGEERLSRDEQDNFERAPWQRLITLQGLSSVILHPSISSSKWREKPYQSWRDACPLFMPYDRGISAAIDAHLSCERRDFNARPFLNRSAPGMKDDSADLIFHMTFYEVFVHNSEATGDIWKNGRLYNDPKNRKFRKCAYTILARSSHSGISSDCASQRTYIYWTILNLTPHGFGKQEKVVGHMHLAVLGLATASLEKIMTRWGELVEFFQSLLEGDDALLDPVQHDHLLFESEDFSKSREYFWAINCLTEFEASISANIEHWENFQHHLLAQEGCNTGEEPFPLNPYAKSSTELLKRSDEYCLRLKRYQRFFKDKRAATIALRDGLFNASSVMESRAATRLGENIKLLTFVSVFFLPLSFCTSLWSTRNGPSNPTTMAYVCIIVGLVTYVAVFNLDLIARTYTRLYKHHKARLLGKMRHEQNTTWRQRSESYDFFQPRHEQEKPTDWYILAYALWRFSTWSWPFSQGKKRDVSVVAREADNSLSSLERISPSSRANM